MAASRGYVLAFQLISFISFILGDSEHGEYAVRLKEDTFNDAVYQWPHFVMFYAPWCGHCKRLGPTWNELAELYNNLDNKHVVIGKVDCTEETGLCAEHSITGYPTLKYFDRSPSEFVRYKGSRDMSSFKSFLEDQLNLKNKEDKTEEPEEEEEEEGSLQELGKDTRDKIKFGSYFIKFFAPWCGHCRRLAPVWEELSKTFTDRSVVNIAQVDCDKHGDVCSTYGINGYPTLIYFTDGQQVEVYNGGRTLPELEAFVMKMVESGEGDKSQNEGRVPDDIPPEPTMVELTDSTYEDVLSDKTVFIKFYAPWCGHCRKLAPTWLDLAKVYTGSNEVVIADVDCTKYSDICRDNQIRGYPTLILFRNGVNVKEYNGPRTLESLQEFVNSHVGIKDEL